MARSPIRAPYARKARQREAAHEQLKKGASGAAGWGWRGPVRLAAV